MINTQNLNDAKPFPTPFQRGFRQNGEWEKQKAVWLAWPSDAALWEENLPGTQNSVADLAAAIHAGGAEVHMLIQNGGQKDAVKQCLESKNVPLHFHEIPFGDIWLRDIGPIFVKNPNGEKAWVCFHFNGWGNKYLFPDDLGVAEKIASLTGFSQFKSSLIFEGGSLEVDGQGTGITTEQCLLNLNRNGTLSRSDINHVLHQYLGLEHLIWLDKGLHNDHTDGHIDNIARFAQPGVVICMESLDKKDPNREVYQNILKKLKKSKDINGKKFEIVTVPAPTNILDHEKNIMPASYLNFLITNDVVAIPFFRCSTDEQAFYRLQNYFPGKKVIGIECLDLITGGGTLHCITQPQFA